MSTTTTSLLVALTILLVTTAPQCRADDLSMQIQRFLDQYVTSDGTEQNFSAVQFSYLTPGSDDVVSYVAGTTEMNGGSEVTEQMLFGWGSISKELVTSLLMMKVESGELNLYHDLGSYLPEYFEQQQYSLGFSVAWPEEWKSVKIYQILNMTSGIPDINRSVDVLCRIGFTGKPYSEFVKENLGVAEIIALTAYFAVAYPEACQDIKFCYSPGSQYNYSNTGYFMAGLIASKLFGGISLQDLLNDHVFPSADDDKDTIYFADGKLPTSILSQMPNSYSKVLGNQNFINVTDYPWNFMGAAGGVIGSTSSLIKILKPLFSTGIGGGLAAGKWGHFVNKKTGDLVELQKDCNPLSCYGLGVEALYNDIVGTLYSYEGEPYGFRTVYLYYACYDYFVTLSVNSAEDGTNIIYQAAGKLANMVLDPLLLPQVGGAENCPPSQTNADFLSAKSFSNE